MILIYSNLKYFTGNDLLVNANLLIANGRRYGLVGPNGHGLGFNEEMQNRPTNKFSGGNTKKFAKRSAHSVWSVMRIRLK